MQRTVVSILFLSVPAIVAALNARSAEAQNNSLYAAEQQTSLAVNNSLRGGQHQQQQATQPQRPGLSLADSSWTYITPMDRRPLEINDIVKVTVSVTSQMSSTGRMDREKKGYADWKLTNWIKFYGWNLGQDKQNYGTPEVRGDLDSKFNAKGDLQTKDKLSFVISCHIVDKRPNGNLVLEGTWSVSDNEEKWEYSLAGECRPEDIKQQENTIISDLIADLKIIRREAGSVRDSYRRGWALQWLDKFQPF